MTLREFLSKYPHKRIRAETGGDSHPRYILGRIGEDKKINVPIGITVFDDKNALIGKYLITFIYTFLTHKLYKGYIKVYMFYII